MKNILLTNNVQINVATCNSISSDDDLEEVKTRFYRH